MSQNVTEVALQIIRNRRRDAERKYEDKISTLEKDKNYQKTQKHYTSLVIENARKEAYSEKVDKTEENTTLKILNSLKAKYGLENAKIEYFCPDCKDTGYVNGKQCICLKSEISKLLLENSGFAKLEDFDEGMKTCGPILLPIYQKMREWCNSNSKKNLIYFAGPIGVGKTYLIRCMANELIKNGKVINIVTSLNLSLDFKTFTKTFEEELLKKYITPEVLFIDDLGTEPIFKNVTIEYLYLIINERKMRNKKTVITSNLDLGDIRERYDERIYSRIVDRNTSLTIFLNGDDKRLKK